MTLFPLFAFLCLFLQAVSVFGQAVGIIGSDTNVNYSPVADTQEVTILQETPALINLTGYDANGDALNFTIVDTPTEGTLSGFDPGRGLVTYNPVAGFTGPDSFTFKVDDGIVFSDIATVTVTTFDYTLSDTGPITVTQGSSGSNTVTQTLVSGTSQPVTLSASGLPTGASPSFTNNLCTPTCSSTLTISTSVSTPAGTYPITVTGSPLSMITSFNLVVQAGGGGSTPEIISPIPGTVLPGGTATFQWITNGAVVDNWRLYVGSTQGANDLYDSGKFRRSLSKTVSGLPTDGRVIWVQLQFKIDRSWQSSDFQYTAASG